MMGKVRVSVTAALALSLLPVFEVPAGAGCGDINSAMALGPFHAGTTPPLFYGTEGGGGVFNVRWTGFSCGQLIQVTAEYSDVPGGATEPADYSLTTGRTPPVCEVGCDPGSDGNRQGATIAFDITNDSSVESVTETFTIVLGNALGGVIEAPASAPFLVIDDEAPSRASFDDVANSQGETYETFLIPVWLAGPAAGATVPFSVGPGPGPSTGATPGADFTVATPSPLVFAPNDRVKFITLSVVNDELFEADETVQIDLQGPAVAPSTKVVTIEDNEEGIAPTSKIHHPRHRWRYPYNDYRIREIHVFTKDELGGSGVVQVELALRRRTMNGNCAWWNGRRFRGGDCSEKIWRPMKAYEPGFFYYYRIKALASSMGTHILNYTAYARATDGAGNMESLLQQRRNRNTFEVKQRTS
jgi:hypothetical protein